MNLKDYFKKAQKGGWALGSFNISNLEALRGIVQAAQKMKSPVIISTSEGESRFIGLKQAVALVKALKEETGLPIFLNLDHGKSFEYIKEAVEAGYDAVHFDGSKLPLEENIEISKKVIEIARPKNILVEGEVGIIGGDFTLPAEAERFVKEAKVDSLAINVGTQHGINEEHIDFQRLEEIKNILKDVPLVLHGGSGVPDEEIKKALKLGIIKININTELRVAFTGALKQSLENNPEEVIPYKYLPEAIVAVQKIVEEKIKLFGSNDKLC